MQRVHTHFETDGLRVEDVQCRALCGDASRDELCARHEFVLPRRGVFVRHVAGRPVVADSNHALFFRRGETHRVSHPIDGGDACTVFAIAERRLREVGGELDPRWADTEVPAAPGSVCTPPRIDLLHRGLLAELRRGGAGLAVEEIVLELVASLLVSDETSERATTQQRGATARRHAELVERTRIELARRLDAKLDLIDLAHTVHSSPFHLSRVFRAQTGTTLRAYHERLRLRAALDRILADERDLTQLALDVGFTHHSHFTNRFRREYGVPPSLCRSRDGLRRLRRVARG